VQALITSLRPREWDLVVTQPGDERVLVRSKELGSVVPVVGDYLLALDGTRRDVQLTRKVAGGIVWMLYCTANLGEDWGDLTAVTATEDRGDFTATATTKIGDGSDKPLSEKKTYGQTSQTPARHHRATRHVHRRGR